MEAPIFYSGTKNASSWAMRAWLALREARVEFTEEVVDIRRPQRFANLARIGRLSPSATVPALAVDGEVIFDSLAIMEYANDVSGGALLPAAAARRALARSVAAWQHAGLSGLCARISFESSFYPFKRPLDADELAQCERFFGFAERLLEQGGEPFLFGAVSLADFALAPTVIRLTRHEAPLEPFPRARAWAANLLGHPLVREWLDEADGLPHIWFDDYLVPNAPIELFPRAAHRGA